MPRKLLLSATAAVLVVAAAATGGIVAATARAASIPGNVFVSPSGKDSNPGTQSAPVKTVQRAQQLVRALNDNMSADVTVVLADGFYRLTSPLTLSSADSGTNGHNIVWTADNGARPVFAGSVQLTGWTRMSTGSPIFVAQAPSGLATRQLYVNGTRADRAHGALPNSLSGQNSTGYSGGGTTMAGWRNPSGAKPQLEFVYRGGLGAWTEPRCPVASISGGKVTMAQPCWSNSTTRACCFADGRAYNLVGRASITEQPTQVENAFQFLSAGTPGQWFLDQGSSKVYYVPRSGENMATADVEAPVLEKLVTGSGVNHVVFNGIQFSYATWLGPDTGTGFSEIQANYQVTGSDGAARQALCDVAPATQKGTCPYAAWTQAPANVSLTSDQNVQFTNDAFVHLGAAGLGLGDGTQNALVKGNVFTDISGSGIQLGNVDMPTATGAAQTLKHPGRVPRRHRHRRRVRGEDQDDAQPDRPHAVHRHLHRLGRLAGQGEAEAAAELHPRQLNLQQPHLQPHVAAQRRRRDLHPGPDRYVARQRREGERKPDPQPDRQGPCRLHRQRVHVRVDPRQRHLLDRRGERLGQHPSRLHAGRDDHQ
ncbi:MAG: hypothetical protein E6F99_18845 [Actinobacteria bacterium]|nr:MAG: hypothetical protein E6F99_18845 [Actinomycetota bacterium]